MSFLRNRKVATKLWLMMLPSILILFTAPFTIGIFGNSINNRAKNVYYNEIYKNSSLLLEADRDFHQALIAEKNLVIDTNQQAKKDTSAKSAVTSKKDTYIKDYNDNLGQLKDRIQSVYNNVKNNKKLFQGFKHKGTGKTFQELYNNFNKDLGTWIAAYNPETGEGNPQEKELLFEKTRENINNMTELLDAYGVEADKDTQNTVRTMITVLIIIMLSL